MVEVLQGFSVVSPMQSEKHKHICEAEFDFDLFIILNVTGAYYN